VDRVVEALLKQAVLARESLADALRQTDTKDPAFPATLDAVRETGLFTVEELAELVGLSRARLYQLMGKPGDGS
jgi:DNA-binding phage protein